jgi:inorganic pyrophosphatase
MHNLEESWEVHMLNEAMPGKPCASGDNMLYLPAGSEAPARVNVVIEIPYGGRNKIEYDKELRVFRLDRVLHSPMYYPGDYGFIPRTLADDGDPLDVLVLVSQPSFSGCLLSARAIGYLAMVDGGKADEKILAVPVGEPDFADIVDFRQVSPHVLRKIAHFFSTYKLLEGKQTSSSGWHGVEEAHQLITTTLDRFRSIHETRQTEGTP